MQTTSKQTQMPVEPTVAGIVSTSTAPRVLSTVELAVATGGAKAGTVICKAGIMVGT